VRNIIALSLLPLSAIALLLQAAAGVPPVRPIERLSDSSLPAITESGDSFVLTREVKLEVDTPELGVMVGRLFLIFDRSTGHYLRALNWSKGEGPVGSSYTDMFRDHAHIGATSQRIWAFFAPRAFLAPGATLEVWQGLEKAENLDDAEAKTLKWVAVHAHIPELQPKIPAQFFMNMPLILPLSASSDAARGKAEFVPETLVSYTLHNGLWEFIFDGYARRDRLYHPTEERKHLRARFTLNSTDYAQSPAYVCVDDKSQEAPCP
jgi:hypothetical protein